MERIEGYATVYLNDDGTFNLRGRLHKTETCAIVGIHLFEGAKVAGIAKVSFDFNRGAEHLTGFEFKMQELKDVDLDIIA